MSQSVPLKRKHKTSSNDTASAPSHHLVFYDAYESYSIVTSKQLQIDCANPEKGKVIDRNKNEYFVSIIKSGDLKYCEKKAKKCEQGKPLVTTDEDMTSFRLDKNNNVLNQSISSDTSIDEVMHKNQKTPKIRKKNLVSELTDEPIISSNNTMQLPSRIVSYEEFNSLNLRFDDLISKFDLAVKTVKNSNDYIHEGKDLINDFEGKTPRKWAIKVISHLFSKEEILSSVLEPSSRTNRPPLSPTRVKLLKEAMKQRFNLNCKESDKHWTLVTEAVNSKGRSIKLADRIRKALSLLDK